MVLRIVCLVITAAAMSSISSGSIERVGCDAPQFVVAVDVGHSRSKPGTTSTRGVPEYEFNIRLAKEFVDRLKVDGYTSAFLIDPDNSVISLQERTNRAIKAKADVFISIHHDTMQEHYLEPWEHNGQTYLHSKKFSGYSIFVSSQTSHAAQNLSLAQVLGESLRSKGLTPTLHHAEPIQGENRTLLNQELGIYDFPQLSVLRRAQYPAILFEAGIILNRDEEEKLNDYAYRKLLISSLTTMVAGACSESVPD